MFPIKVTGYILLKIGCVYGSCKTFLQWTSCMHLENSSILVIIQFKFSRSLYFDKQQEIRYIWKICFSKGNPNHKVVWGHVKFLKHWPYLCFSPSVNNLFLNSSCLINWGFTVYDLPFIANFYGVFPPSVLKMTSSIKS